jgi:hypothetical protein
LACAEALFLFGNLFVTCIPVGVVVVVVVVLGSVLLFLLQLEPAKRLFAP